MKIKRRSFGLLAGSSMAALKFGCADAQTAPDPTLLTTTLTPFGSERAGNADGSIPAWTGGYTTLPPGWQPGQYMPDFFADEKPILTVNSSNMAQHADELSDGTMALMTKYGFSIDVYPTHRTQSVPQSVADNIAKNVTRVALVDPNNPQNGFKGGFSGIPFPIPDTSDPLVAGAQIMANHLNRWNGFAVSYLSYGIVVNSGNVVMSFNGVGKFDYPYYYRPDISTTQVRTYIAFSGPAYLVGEEVISVYFHDATPTETWELLNGQGRVRKAPELTFDTPSSFNDGAVNYDEFYGYAGRQIEYNWKSLGKKEMYIPYNNNALIAVPYQEALKSSFIDPNLVRWELHRVWVVEATVRSDSRNVLARRRFYIDEDTWTVALTDSWDANGNLFHVAQAFNVLRPDMPGLFMFNNAVYNLQTEQYTMISGPWNDKAVPSLKFLDSWPDSTYDPENMAAAAQY